MKPATRKIIGYTIGLLLLVAAGIAYYAYSEFNRKLKDTSSLRPDHRLNADQLISEFEKNDSMASVAFLDKVIEVKGPIKESIKDDAGYLTLVIRENGTTSIRCSMDSAHSKEASELKSGVLVSVKGICSGFNRDELLGSDIVLVRCVLVNK